MQIEVPPQFVIERIVRVALEEDLGRGDVTTTACVSEDAFARTSITAREPMVLAGAIVVHEVFRQVDPRIELAFQASDGASLDGGASIGTVRGPARAVLMCERVMLNFIQRLSGIATSTRRFVDALPAGSPTRITDTRKTTPGLRPLERYAVRAGGGHNHRDDLSSAVLIKDNHIAAAGGVAAAIGRARRFAPHTSRVECEVDDLPQLEEALHAGADVVLLDNFTDDQVEAALAVAKGRAFVEVSGGITVERVATLGALGVDAISVGALTHSARSMDIGLDWLS